MPLTKDEHIEIVLMAGSGSCHQVALELGYQTVAIVGRDKSVCAFTKYSNRIKDAL